MTMKFEKTSENIELRSEKVRAIVGQIPPMLIRFGMTLILVIVGIFISFGYFFEYPYQINATIKFVKKEHAIIGELLIPINDFDRIEVGNKAMLSFPGVPKGTITSSITSLTDRVLINETGNYGIALVHCDPILESDEGLVLDFSASLMGEAKVFTKPSSLFKHFMNSYQFIPGD